MEKYKIIIAILAGIAAIIGGWTILYSEKEELNPLNYDVSYAEPDEKIDLSLVPHTVEITGLKENYNIGEPIDFTIILKGNGTFCKGYDLQIHNMTRGSLWGNKGEQNVCSIEPLEFERVFQYSSYHRTEYTYTDKLIVDDIPEAHQYEANYAIVFVTGYGDAVKRTFTVTNSSDFALTDEQILDIKHTKLGCAKTANQTACDEMIQEKINYYKELNENPCSEIYPDGLDTFQQPFSLTSPKRLVLFMKQNSTAQMCVKYTSTFDNAGLLEVNPGILVRDRKSVV